MSTLRIAAVGSGYFSQFHYDAWRRRVSVRPHASNDEQLIDVEWEDRGFAGDSVYRYRAHVLAHLRDGKPLVNAARDYLRNMQLVEAVYRSNETGTWVKP